MAGMSYGCIGLTGFGPANSHISQVSGGEGMFFLLQQIWFHPTNNTLLTKLAQGWHYIIILLVILLSELSNN